jgi:hypothetical protein
LFVFFDQSIQDIPVPTNLTTDFIFFHIVSGLFGISQKIAIVIEIRLFEFGNTVIPNPLSHPLCPLVGKLLEDSSLEKLTCCFGMSF